jgi:hypothetical protein
MHYIDKYIHFIDTPIKNNLIFDELQLVKKNTANIKAAVSNKKQPTKTN